MIFNEHLDLNDKHALLSPSSYHWLNYDGDSDYIFDLLFNRYRSQYAQSIGTYLHEFAEKRINWKLKLDKSEKKDVIFYLLDRKVPRSLLDINEWYETLKTYVNDAISLNMNTEVKLVYSNNCFGTADTISFDDGYLRIHDLKTGRTPAHMEQLEIYAALFCLEYHYSPKDISSELRIYQSGEVIVHEPEPDEIESVMDQIIFLDGFSEKLKESM